ncbi:class I SAM-dependent methyltransferase [Thermovibrio ammonificans]
MEIFDKAARRWDEKPSRVENAKLCARAIRELVPLEKGWKVLEVGAGTGLLTLFLEPFVSQIVAVDTSAGMVEVLREKVEALGLEGKVVPYLGTVNGSFPYSGFNVAVTHMTLHHVEEPRAFLGELVRRLSPGGWLAVSDLDKEDGTFHSNNEGVFHFGFSKEEVEELFRSVGVEPVGYKVFNVIRKRGREYPVFLCVGRLKG